MNTLKLLALAVTMIFGAAALADVEEKREIEIVVEGISSDDGTSFHWVSNDSDLDMQSMQVGETQSIVDESGRSVLITREEEGFRFDVDGKSVVVPDMGVHGAHMAFISSDTMSGDFDVDVEIIGDHTMTMSDGSDGVTIISGEPLDAITKETIKSVLQSAGRSDEVTFIDGSGDGRHVKIIKKKIEIAQ